MDEKDKLQQGALNQIAWILNYQPTIENQTIIVGERPKTRNGASKTDGDADRETVLNKEERKVTRETFRTALIALFEAKDMKGKALFKRRNHWVALFRVAVDELLVEDNAFEAFVSFIRELQLPYIPEGLSRQTLNNSYVGIYTKPLEEWTLENYRQKRLGDGAAREAFFLDMLAVAQKLASLLS